MLERSAVYKTPNLCSVYIAADDIQVDGPVFDRPSSALDIHFYNPEYRIALPRTMITGNGIFSNAGNEKITTEQIASALVLLRSQSPPDVVHMTHRSLYQRWPQFSLEEAVPLLLHCIDGKLETESKDMACLHRRLGSMIRQ